MVQVRGVLRRHSRRFHGQGQRVQPRARPCNGGAVGRRYHREALECRQSSSFMLVRHKSRARIAAHHVQILRREISYALSVNCVMKCARNFSTRLFLDQVYSASVASFIQFSRERCPHHCRGYSLIRRFVFISTPLLGQAALRAAFCSS